MILIVDDQPQNLQILGEMLRDEFDVRAASSGPRALRLMGRAPRPDLVLLDVMMPQMNGYEVLQRMKDDPATRDVPVIFTTAMSAAEDEQRGLALGAVDYITKPLRPALVLARVRTHLTLKGARDRLSADNVTLEREVTRRTHEIQLVQDVTIRALARLAEARDNDTGNHILRTQEYVHRLAGLAAGDPRYAGVLDACAIELIAKSAPLHDIGKVGIPDHILCKPGPLTPDEWTTMKTHARIGAEALDRAQADACHALPFLVYARQIALHHHERWDGSGYPEGLAGEAIPLAARLMAIADVFDALISVRVYKPALPAAEARRIMLASRGSHFDPTLLDLFVAHFEDFCEIARRLPDEAAPDLRVSARPVHHG